MCTVSVSYTHLDVYKRQILTDNPLNDSLIEEIKSIPGAVSYTHLGDIPMMDI